MKSKVQEYISSGESAPFFRDASQEMYLVERAADQKLMGKGVLEVFGDRIELVEANGEKHVFPWHEINGMSIHGPKVLVFSTENGKSYEVRTDIRRSAVKYLDVFKCIGI